ncbi:NAD-dependent deacylase [Pontibacter sp. BT310]|uniref:NAD-dependent protein deacylase n=1 Tax=Pontibacter populi TaxID=890055 RepID=A0ABS6XA67_9BACT|nr:MULTISPECIES: NAD-dependent deacylase [Pontibacter]MBJ6118044.1 NAD-dependent deacylase [Pontibacter sp. BT310]MBR0570471.1 NAD-dependent deacylase [Microvirga sp. STS03]MBW3364897.1 NAD-dependent deacylase [Pontibacter populi]
MKKKLVVLTGAGISAESGIATFRDADGLWEGYDVMEVATPKGWRKNPELVLEFYNQRRKNAHTVKPNQGHTILADLEKQFDVHIITQNVDDLHERAGSTNVLHLHGKLFESRSTLDEKLVYKIEGWELKKGDKCERGSQLRPNIVWFGEPVPMMENAVEETLQADIFLVVGTSLVVYPAAGLVDLVPEDVPVIVVDPKLPLVRKRPNLHLIEDKASTGMEKVKQLLLEKYL